MYVINTKKIGSCRFKNNILLYLENVTNASVIYQEVMLRCAIFLFKCSQGLEVSENRTYIGNTDENVTKCYYHGNMFFLKFQSTILKNKQDINQNVFLLIFEMS